MNPNSLFNLAGPDLFVILIIVLLVFGAKNLPELTSGLAQAIHEFSKAIQRFFGVNDEESAGWDGQSGGNRQSDIVNRVLLVLAVLAGFVSIAVAMES